MTSSAAPTDFEYDAFLSYATEADYELARELEDFLERFHELPTPVELSLRPLSIWRDGSDVSLADSAPGGGITAVLEAALARCRYLVLLWSEQSCRSQYMRSELDWFLSRRGPESVLLAITDARDPDPVSTVLFVPVMIDAGLTQRPWYDFRGYHKDRLVEARRLRDFDEARVQLAADLNGYRPADIQPLWWRNKVREEQARAEREERARRRIELAECDARLEAANGWYERAFTAFGDRDYGAACDCLLEALAIANPQRVPEHYERTLERPGWAEGAWAFLRYVLALTPRIQSLGPVAGPEPDAGPVTRLAWAAGGRDVVLVRGNVLEVRNPARGEVTARLTPPDGAGAITAWAAAGSTNLVIVGTDSGRVTAWSGEAREALVLADGHGDKVTAAGIAPDGSTAVTGSADGEIRVWTGARSEVVREAGEETVSFVALVDENRSLLFRIGSELRLRQLASGEERTVYAVLSDNAVATDGHGKAMAYGEWDVVHRCDVRNPDDAVLYVGVHRGFIDEITFAAGGEHLFTRATGNEVCVWAGRERPLERGQSFMGARMTQTFAAANRGSLLKRLDHLGEVHAIATHPEDPERFAVVRGRDAVAEGHLGFTWRPSRRWRPAATGHRSAAWLPDGRGIVCGADDGLFAFLPLDGDPVPLASFDAAVGDVAVSPDGALAAAVTKDGLVAVHALADTRQLAATHVPSVPFGIAFTQDDGGTVAVGGHDGVIRLWTWAAGNAARRLGGCDSPVLALTADSQAGILVAGCESGELAAWNLAEELPLWSTEDTSGASLSGVVHDVSIAPGGTIAVAGTMSGAVRVVELATGREVAWIPVRGSVPGKPEQVTAVGACDDGRTAVVGLWDGTLCVLDLKAARELLRFPAHTKVVTAAAQAHGTGHVMTASLDDDPQNDGVRLWTMLDAETVPPPHAGLPDWADAARTAVSRRNGVEPRTDGATAPGGEPEPARIPALRLALAEDPQSPERNMELAAALIEAGHAAAAQDLVARAYRYGGESLITDPQVQGLLAVSLLAEGRTEAALPWLREAAAAHDAEALMQLGLLYLNREIPGGSEAGAVQYLTASAELGHTLAAYNLGVYYEHVAPGAVAETDWRLLALGESGGTGAHEAEAIRWYTLAADQGCEPAEEALSRLNGWPPRQD